MFSTFTGNSRRPRNVNLSGQAGNPFSNTSWSPSAVSSATKTVSNAQADREKRQAERQRLKAAGQIQRTWRGHKARKAVANSRRDTFDNLYESRNGGHIPVERLPFAFNLVLAFFNPRRDDDVRRLVLFVRDCETVDLEQIPPSDAHPSRLKRFVQILVDALNRAVSQTFDGSHETYELLKLAARISYAAPYALSTSANGYYTALAVLCSKWDSSNGDGSRLAEAVIEPLKRATSTELEGTMYEGLAFCFLAHGHVRLLEENVDLFAQNIDVSKLAMTISQGYTTGSKLTNDQLISLLAHYIHLKDSPYSNTQGVDNLHALHVQLSALSSEISLRLRETPEETTSVNPSDAKLTTLNDYVSRQLLSLVNDEGITQLLRSFSDVATNGSNPQQIQGTSLLAGYTSTLLQCFPNQSDDIRMRLFLTTIPTAEGDLPTVKFLWNGVKRSMLFRKVIKEAERPAVILRNYLNGTFNTKQNIDEERDWRVILIFLELYTFVLRLSDDDDFFSGVNTQLMEDTQSSSRIRACSLALEDLTDLTTFLKNSCFSMYYEAKEVTLSSPEMNISAFSRLDYVPGSQTLTKTGSRSEQATQSGSIAGASTRLDFNSLRELLSTTMRMLYERDSRKPFLPSGHWLMTGKLERENFINAVIAEDERQRREEEEDDSSSEEEESYEPSYNSVDSLRRGFRQPNAYARLERIRINHKRAQRERRLAETGPKLEILKHMPFVVPFETRVKIFRQFINLDRAEREGRAATAEDPSPFWAGMQNARHQADIRRGQLFEDAFDKFYPIGEGLKDPISITFVDQFDAPEAGIDGGGVTKEFLTSVTAEAFSRRPTRLDMFASNEKELLFPDPMAMDRLRTMLRDEEFTESMPEWREHTSRFLKEFEFLGRIIGKCLYEGILVDLVFAGFFLLQWPSSGPREGSSYKGSVNDLRDMDEDFYKGMLRLKNYPGDVSELGLDFTIEDQVSLPDKPVKTVTRNLMPNGDKVPVTNDNRLLYISYVARHRLVNQPALQTSAFLRGLRSIIRPSWLSMFNQIELQRLVGGDSSEIDVEDLRRNTIYGGVYVIGDDHEEHPTIKLFWKVMKGFTDAQRRDVLKYVSSAPRAPLLGFSQLFPKFSIRDAGQDEERLPSTSTCVNLLKLPQYRTERAMREKLLYAITSGAGFDLS